MEGKRTILNDGKPVTFAVEDGFIDTVTATVSVKAGDDGVQYLEYRVPCPTCKAENWLAVGTDSSEYRCIKCTWWLGVDSR
jgi:hypothetical protein